MIEKRIAFGYRQKSYFEKLDIYSRCMKKYEKGARPLFSLSLFMYNVHRIISQFMVLLDRT